MRVTALLLFATSASCLRAPVASQGPLGNWIAEAEKKHSRVALLAVPALVGLQMVTHSDPVVWLNHRPAAEQISFYCTAAVLESLNLRRLGPGLSLKDGESPGKLVRTWPSPSAKLSAAEDTAGRAAMLVAFLYLLRSL